jgi:hypothetical protein
MTAMVAVAAMARVMAAMETTTVAAAAMMTAMAALKK